MIGSPGFEVRLTSEAAEQLRGLDPSVGGRIWDRLHWLGHHAGQIRHLPLSGDLSGLYKRRIGDYRVIYEIVRERRALVVHRIGHRREVYKGL